MNQITKENILQAINEIKENGVTSGRHSSTYDLIYEGKPYPPKLVISIANRYATDEELDPNTFSGGLDTPAFKLLEKEGFTIIAKAERKTAKITNFADLIIPLMDHIKNGSSVIHDFTISEHKRKAKWIWISDAVKIIGDYDCHYEIIERNSSTDNSKKEISVEIHFEDKTKKEYFNKLKDFLPDHTYWNAKHKAGKSISYKNSFNYDDPDLLFKIEEALIYLEDNLGNKIRKLKSKKYSVEQMENMFNDFLKTKISAKSVTNYLSAIPTISRISLPNLLFDSSVYEIQSNYFFNLLIDLLKNNTEYVKLNERGKSMYSSSLNYYKSFIEELSTIFQESNRDNKMSLNQILYGPPGTGKTYNTINKSLEIIGESIDGKTREEVKELFDNKVKEGQIVFSTFHQNMSYEDFIEGIKPQTVNNKVNYKIENGIFKNLCERASQKKTSKNFDESYSKFTEEVLTKGFILLETPTHKKKFKVIINSNDTAVAIPETQKRTNMGVTKEMSRDYIFNGKIRDWKPYTTAIGEYIKKEYPVDVEEIDNSNKNFVLIIDEINRGNVSKIFGELITLIEENKRTGRSEAITAILPYSKEEFSVPENVYILGTMNTADRSVEALDTALRRRFDFVEMMPRYDLIDDEDNDKYFFNDIHAFDILETINKRIEVLLDRDHLIGHSFLLLDGKENIESKLQTAFYKNIIPLLQEFFYGDYNKIGLVLGSGFVAKTKVDNSKYLFADSSDFNGSDYVNEYSTTYSIRELQSDETFYKALEILMNRPAYSEINE